VFAIRATHAFDGENFRAGGVTVFVEDGGIVGVEPMGYELPSDCELVDYGNATVLPGLIDTHVHLVGDSDVIALDRAAGYSPEQIDAVVSEALRRQLAAGVTTVRDLAIGTSMSSNGETRSARWTTGCPGLLPRVRRSPPQADTAATSAAKSAAKTRSWVP
jgi:imidazolonepropionase-like amidohydrolase